MILLKNSLIYITIHVTFVILLQSLIVVKSQITTFIPDPRHGHTATVINDKLYILGGQTNVATRLSPKESFLYLDISVPFNTDKLEWHEFSTNNIVPSHKFAAAIKGGADNNTLFLYGGQSNESIALVYTFNNNVWSIPEISGIPPNGNEIMTLIIDYKGLIYLFGGYSNKLRKFTNDMFILDTINLSWKKVSSINAPSPRGQYGAVLLPNQKILYMGGFDLNGSFSLNEVYLYDTINDNWTTKTTSGSIPSPRYSFSSILGLDGQRVIIFGGLKTSSELSDEALYVLDTNNFNWFIPKFSGEIPKRTRAAHKAVLIERYMFITFGLGYTQGNGDNDILLLDISNNDNYVWTSSFKLLPTLDSNNIGAVVGVVVGSLIGSILLVIGSFCLYKWYKNNRRNNNAILTPGGETDKEILQNKAIPVPTPGSERDKEVQNKAIPIPTPGSERDEILQIPDHNHEQEIIRISGNTRS